MCWSPTPKHGEWIIHGQCVGAFGHVEYTCHLLVDHHIRPVYCIISSTHSSPACRAAWQTSAYWKAPNLCVRRHVMHACVTAIDVATHGSNNCVSPCAPKMRGVIVIAAGASLHQRATRASSARAEWSGSRGWEGQRWLQVPGNTVTDRHKNLPGRIFSKQRPLHTDSP